MRWTAGVDWQLTDFRTYLGVNYVGEFEQKEAVQKDGMDKVDAMMTVDASINYLGLDNTVLTLGATNLLDEEPPFSYHDFMGYVPTVHSGQGRFVYLQASYKF